MTFNAIPALVAQKTSNVLSFKAKQQVVSPDKIVAVYGSSSTRPGCGGAAQKDYEDAQKLGMLLAKEGYGVLTGGSVGSMEAVNKGCKEAGGHSIGVTLELLKKEQKANDYCDELIRTDHFYPRLEKYREKSSFQVAGPGGVGTVMEVMEMLCMLLTNRTHHQHQGEIMLMDKKFWGGFKEWLQGEPLKRGYIQQSRIDALKLVDTPEEVVEEIKKGPQYDPIGIQNKWGGKFYDEKGLTQTLNYQA